ncbi:unnamed protein product [Zymoseptoria tritici ST99CH_3D1]|uniref:tRNA-splicing endonuclease subunit Sen15 domain-containing protein n=1 Tax=Zymoseptoria tritici (strain CBS 115943 / IPO323) TaxID=336722 RepID=F9WWN6_ZYMTI|nr:uncharacterized protein MYCGRDRAFT_102532 [Zymoseptoria tritici IPO323]EGP91351.1 hypothetical protein MYCGRDRAFT_102532 [Zymoseptoria tritici IPO323]SMR44571.1 unnamed protein product [Zymoseptoria tritici ST99CH_3D1]
MSSTANVPSQSTLPPLSALQALLITNPLPSSSPHTTEHQHLALQIAHNLKHQHNWTSLRLHTYSSSKTPLSRPLLSGIPPSRLYVHPDEQIALLQRAKEQQPNGTPSLTSLKPEREWILPSHLREKWSLRKFGEVFDGIGVTPGSREGVEVLEEESRGRTGRDVNGMEKEEVGEWREKLPKRVLLATADDDSTVVYYVVHDGVVKPRQN